MPIFTQFIKNLFLIKAQIFAFVLGPTQRVRPFDPLLYTCRAIYIVGMTNTQALSLQLKTLYSGQSLSDQDALNASQRLVKFVEILMQVNAQQPKGHKYD